MRNLDDMLYNSKKNTKTENRLCVPEELDATRTVERQLFRLVRQRLQIRVISVRHQTIPSQHILQQTSSAPNNTSTRMHSSVNFSTVSTTTRNSAKENVEKNTRPISLFRVWPNWHIYCRSAFESCTNFQFDKQSAKTHFILCGDFPSYFNHWKQLY